MDKLSSQLSRFFQLAAERKLCGNDQLVYLHILNQFHRAHWAETLRIKDAELLESCRIHDSSGKPASIETIRRCKQRLKAKGFINFSSGNGKPTLYQFIWFAPADTPANIPADSPAQTPVDTPVDTPADTSDASPADTPAGAPTDSSKKISSLGLVCYTPKRAHADAGAHKVLNISKVLVKKGIEEEEEDADALACAGENYNNENSDFAENRAPCKHPDDLRTMDVCTLWTYATGYRLSRYLETQLHELDLTHGRESFNLALTQAVSAKEDEERETGKKMFVKFNYFTTILRSLKKEGEKNEKASQATQATRTTSNAPPNRRASQATRTIQQHQRYTPRKYEVPDYSSYPF